MVREQLPAEREPALDRVRIREPDLVHRALQPLEMLAPAQHHAVVHRDHFVDAVAEDEAAVERRDGDAVDRQELAVEMGDRGGHREGLIA